MKNAKLLNLLLYLIMAFLQNIFRSFIKHKKDVLIKISDKVHFQLQYLFIFKLSKN